MQLNLGTVLLCYFRFFNICGDDCMDYEFSTNLEGAQCHIRAFRDQVVPREQVRQRPHKHFFMEFHCVFSGEERVTLPLQKTELSLRPGQILMIPREVYHGVFTDGDGVDRLCFNFSVESDSRNNPVVSYFRSINEPRIFENEKAMALIAHYQSLERGTPLFSLMQGSLLLAVVLELFSGVSGVWQQTHHEDSRALRQKWIIEDYIATCFTEPEGLEGLARRLYLSQRQTRNLVRQFLGEEYKTLIIRRRMELADIFLEDPEKSLEDIAREVGYSSYSGFQLAFRRHFGVTPRERRKTLQAGDNSM